MPQDSLQAFLSRLFDYAGLFPPANLPLAKAIQKYAEYQKSEDSWMLGRFIIPATRLEELDRYMGLFAENKPLLCGALGRKSDNESGCLMALHTDLNLINSFQNRYSSAINIGVLELPLPPVIPQQGFLNAITTKVAKQKLEVFCEVTVSLDSEWQNTMLATLDVIAEHNATKETPLGIKLRTGGLTASAFPSPEQIASVLAGCRERMLPLKFTAGLHHPVRMFREEVKTRMHGFLNVYTAGLLANTENLNLLKIEEILADEAPSSFSFSTDVLTWKNYQISTEQIDHLRSTMLRSYGTCSFDEPREDLVSLKIL